MDSFGVYIHFPYCLRKCPYCDFVSYARDRSAIDHRGYADAVLAELSARRAAFTGRRLASVFFGGGTPSLWEPEELGRVLSGVLEAAEARDDEVEITVECNPTSLDEVRARALRDVGVNRLSVGVQGLDAERLRFLGRLHDPEGGVASLAAALRSGVPRVSADLIHGVHAGRDPDAPATFADEAARIAETGVTHVSAYGLTIEPSTAFGDLARKGALAIAPDEAIADAFFAVEAALERRGLVHYEISNYAVLGDEARHNLGYWRGDDYLGLGCAAVGTLSDPSGSALRYRNPKDPIRYQAEATLGKPLDAEREELDPETRLRERIMLGLRLAVGLDLERAAEALGVAAWTPRRRRAAERLEARGRLVVEGGRVRIPAKARIWTDGIAAEMF